MTDETTGTYSPGDYNIPRINVINETQKLNTAPGMAGKVAVIGAFPTTDQTIRTFRTIKSFRHGLSVEADKESETNFNGCLAVKRLFMEGRLDCSGVSEVIICNITSDKAIQSEGGTVTGTTTKPEYDANQVITPYNTTDYTKMDTKLTYDKLKAGLNRLVGESFDMLFIADPLNDAMATQVGSDDKGKSASIISPFVLINDFLNKEFQIQKPTQLYCPIIKPYGTSSITTSTDTNGKVNPQETVDIDTVSLITSVFEENPFNLGGLYVQQGVLSTDTTTVSSVVETAAHIVGYISSLNVGTSLTNKTIPGIRQVKPELYYTKNEDGYSLVSAGVQCLKCKNRTKLDHCIVNSKQPSGYDLAHIRAVSYLIRQYDLEDFLGDNSSNAEIETIGTALSAINQQTIADVPLIQAIDTSNIEKVSPSEVTINLEVTVAGIIIVINLGVNMEVE